jgi:glycosyltransferase involved in cell wall biosynthesis
MKRLRWALIGDGQSPHLLKWARALGAHEDIELWVASSRGFLPEWEDCLPQARRLALNAQARHQGGNVGVLRQLPRLGTWLAAIQPEVLNPHYITSHGTLAVLAKRLWGLRARTVASAWGSDILDTPASSGLYAALTRWILRRCDLCTSDSAHMSERMRSLGASEVVTFPFGLEALPQATGRKQPWLFYANRGLEPIYQPHRVLEVFAALAKHLPEARLVVANDGSLLGALQDQAQGLGLAGRLEFVGRLDAQQQAHWYSQAQWFLSLPRSDSVSVSVIEAMAHGAIPLLSDLPANREVLGVSADSAPGLLPTLQGTHRGGLVLDVAALNPTSGAALAVHLQALAGQAPDWGARNRQWVAEHALFPPCVHALIERVKG